jgi:hypothetical protein
MSHHAVREESRLYDLLHACLKYSGSGIIMGKCKQFTRKPKNEKVLCGLWNKPSTATSSACIFFSHKKPICLDRAVDEN